MIQMDEHWEGIPAHWMTYFAVDDIDVAAQRVGDLSGRVAVPPFDGPAGRIAVLADPAGAVFSVIALGDPGPG